MPISIPRRTFLRLVALGLGSAACSRVGSLLGTATPSPYPTTVGAVPTGAQIIPSSTPGSTLIPVQDLPFPRLGMWWPNPSEQPLQDIARYGYVALQPPASEFIDPLRKLNPNILLLNSTNACEVYFDPTNPDNYKWLQEFPYEWYLTQVGTNLRANVDATQTVLPVDALTASNGTTTYDLFLPGDTALIADESVYVNSVDKTSRTLTVQRGYIRPASAHVAGTRIAAHISFWPNSWILNLSTLSPKGMADPAVGPEPWSSYHAQLDAKLLDDPRWAGLLADRTDPNKSWLIGMSTARTIDPDQSNKLLSDYAAFDAAWNAGLRLYLQGLRDRIGPDKIILLNGGISSYGLVNGSNFEGFPNDTADNWHNTVFGPSPSGADIGSYFEWLANARQPHLTMIETYDDNSSPAANDTKGYANRCNDPDFVPNYRKMRFGLTTAMLNNGFFSYEMNTNGHGSLCLMWFDEYDNAGAGRGYLGQPIGPTAPIDLGSFTQTQIVSTGFNSYADLGMWSLSADNGYAASWSIDTSRPATGLGSLRVHVSESKGSDWRVWLVAQPITVNGGTNYTLTFRARADHPLAILASCGQDHAPWTIWFQFYSVPLTTEWQQFTFTAPSMGSDKQARLIFGLGKTTGTIWLDDVLLQTARPDIYRRDFEHGIVLVNASTDQVTIPLGGTFKKINGTQDRSVNEGTTVNDVTIPPVDGIILLRP